MNCRVASLAKLKRMYSHAAEKNDYDFKKEFSHLYARFERETVDLVGHHKLQKPIEYYFYIGLKAFEYGLKFRNTKGAFDLPLSAYIDFLNIIMYSAEKNTQATPGMTTDKELIAKLRNINWAEYNLKVEADYS
jgi:hypothetical protein